MIWPNLVEQLKAAQKHLDWAIASSDWPKCHALINEMRRLCEQIEAELPNETRIYFNGIEAELP